MAIYYFVAVIATILIGTAINASLTHLAGNKHASIHRAFFFTLSKFALLLFLGVYFSFYEHWVVLLLIGYYLLFRRIYRVKSFARGLRFLIFSTTFSMPSRIILLGPVTDYMAIFIY